MEKRIQEIIELGNIYDWSVVLTRDRLVNFRNESDDLVSLYWNSKNEYYTVIVKLNGKKPTSFKKCNLLFIEDIFSPHKKQNIKPITVITFGMIDNFLHEHGETKAAELIGKFKEWLP